MNTSTPDCTSNNTPAHNQQYLLSFLSSPPDLIRPTVLIVASMALVYLQGPFKATFSKILGLWQGKKVTSSNSPAPPQGRNVSFYQEQSYEFLRNAAYFGVVFTCIASVRRAVPFDISFLVGSMLSDWLSSPIKAMATSAGILAMPSLVDVHLSHAMALRRFYDLYRKAHFSESMQFFLEAALNAYIREITVWEEHNQATRNMLAEVMRLPVDLKDVEIDEAAFRDFIKSYPDQVQQEVASFMVDIINSAKESAAAPKARRKAIPLMMVGPPGTGKTHLANKIGEFTGLPVKAINLSKYKSNDRLEGEGSIYSYSPNYGLVADILLDHCGKEESFANKIVILDEVDKSLYRDKHGSLAGDGDSLLCFLLEFLEQATTEMSMARYDHAYHDISNLKIILIANKTFTVSGGGARAGAREQDQAYHIRGRLQRG